MTTEWQRLSVTRALYKGRLQAMNSRALMNRKAAEMDRILSIYLSDELENNRKLRISIEDVDRGSLLESLTNLYRLT